MLIGGIQKLSLLDYPEKICCTIFTAGCNYRCPFCHNASILQPDLRSPAIPEEEVLEFLKKRKGLIDGVCITGGEPLLQPQIADFIANIRGLGFLVKLDTNGSFPDKLNELIEANLLDYVAMDVKNSPEKYGLTVGTENYDIRPVEESISLLLSGKLPYEFRTTVVRELHTCGDFQKIARWIQGAEHYYLQSFVDSEDVLVSGFHSCSSEELQEFLKVVQTLVPSVRLRGV
ncbi:anaerobic ribonucleoside-triphosphate reductase activating protein [Novisyntrophococcus fermenticellae]|uniref:anaerobic ribonucleoside-triphosphate reductase activating protein n=1 Tax=Novisyntrophococcus fermenticellae TaxID=2068655 RepID=UPI001E5F843A|nr:anaerobic ribonucleoside-triphosphate reductase activating protein [Novisyntrophococcus fermenticellae]